MLSTSTVVKITVDWYTNIREKQELVTETMQSELRFLKSQINPHFLFNTLNSLYALTLKKSDIAPDIVLKLSEMMRYMLYECNEKWVPLGKELNYVANYLEMERIRQGSRVDISYEINGLVSDQKIAPLMFIPFIENCFKHGLGSQISKGYVNINLPDEEKPKKYGVKFYTEEGEFIFEIKEVKEKNFKIDKTNFYHAGWFRFELFEEGKLLEKHKFYIEKVRPLSAAIGDDVRR